jgi:hypothetical protein
VPELDNGCVLFRGRRLLASGRRQSCRSIDVMQLEQTQRQGHAPDLLILGDVNQSLKDWFGRQRKSVVVLRPDKFVAAATLPMSLAQVTREFMKMFPGARVDDR